MQPMSVLTLAMIIAGPAAHQLLDADIAGEAADWSSLLQVSTNMGSDAPLANRDLVMVHVPYNFGHTVEGVAMFAPGPDRYLKYGAFIQATGGVDGTRAMPQSRSFVESLTKPGGEIWSRSDPDLQVLSNITGCPMYFTPQKYWPSDLAERYFGDKHVFGLLRDPYERLVAFFRGQLPGYGESNPEALATCDVNSAVKKMMNDTLHGNVFRNGCVFIPQAEYFEGPYKITVPVDNRRFPQSMNTVFAGHGYSNMHIDTEDIFHVGLCNDVWAGDLDCETRKMVREFYWRDFELICEHFGYCDDTENACITGVPHMCPAQVLASTGGSGVTKSTC